MDDGEVRLEGEGVWSFREDLSVLGVEADVSVGVVEGV